MEGIERMIWPTPNQLIEFYGNPDKNGTPNPKWESANLVRIRPPYPMFWSWNGEPVTSIRIHQKCAKSLLTVLEGIGNSFTAMDRRRFQLDQCGGGYNFRLMRGSNKLSMHSYGCAIDLAPEINGLGVPYDPSKNMMPLKAVEIFKSQGWKWGGKWSRPDSMHFEATS